MKPPTPLPPARPNPVRRRFTVRGVVQGVGFRPFVYRLARAEELDGHVRNVAAGVRIEVQGSEAHVEAFARRLATGTPPLAIVDSIELLELPLEPGLGFLVLESLDEAGDREALVAPDMAPCDACLAELDDPYDRRYRYPFLNCTDCGPRFTVIEQLPYDRPLTTMREFIQCPLCAAEYADPANRRFHAEPNACPDCGPRLSWLEPGESLAPGAAGDEVTGEAALAAALDLLVRGGIVALKGVGGFHLACVATDDRAVRRLRERKGREGKPFAMMVRDLGGARLYATISPEEEALLTSRERPVVLLRRRRDGQDGDNPSGDGPPASAQIVPKIPPPIAPQVAPGQETLGIVLPYSPLHHLLLGETPLVMTSGNRSDEPIVRDNREALAALQGIADGFLLHDRGIHLPCDDSVVRVGPAGPIPIRRARGYAPLPLRLPFLAPPLLATGGELKAAFCLAQGRHATLSQHLGDLGTYGTRIAFERTLRHFLTLYRVEPEWVACDLHPDYASSRWAEDFASTRSVPLVRVQHHHAHIASVLAEHGDEGGRPVLGVAFDGTGYGPDGTLWGGEILLADYLRSRRLAHLRPVPMPGGEAAIRHPGRMALSYLRAAGIGWSPALPCVAARTETELRFLDRQLEAGLGSPLTSSAGRLFDAMAALLGLRQDSSYEGQAAMELEALTSRAAALQPGEADDYRFAVEKAMDGDDRAAVLDPAPLFRCAVADLGAGVAPATIAARFHAGVARAIADGCRAARDRLGVAAPETVALSGGAFQNVHLLGLVLPLLGEAGFRVLQHRLVPPNDGGLALGQAAIAAALARQPDSEGADPIQKGPAGRWSPRG